MKKLFSLATAILFTLIALPALACDVCQDQQPEPLKNITHGAGPQGQIDYFIVTAAIIIVGLTLFFSIKYLMKPGEKRPNHVKHIVLNNF